MTETGNLHVLHVDNHPGMVSLTAEMLEREDDRFTVTTATSASEGLDRFSNEKFDCVVSDYDMPGQNGLEFLDVVREEYPDLPFILFTGEGSEELASDAISAGVTDYVQKERGNDQYAMLANRIDNAVERARTNRECQRQLDAIETAREGISILDADGHFIYVNEAYADLYGYDPGQMCDEHWELIYPAEEVGFVHDEILPTVEQEGIWHGETTGLRADGSIFLEDHTVAATDRNELICTVQDITAQEDLHQKHQLVARASTDAFFDWNLRTDEVTRNEWYLTMFGYDSSAIETSADWWRERIHPDDRDRVLAAVDRAVENPATRYDETYRFEKKNGTYGTLRSRGYVVYDENNNPERLVGVHIDVTERKEHERKLEVRSAAMEASIDGMAILDADDEYVFVNQSHADIYGYEEPDAFLGETWQMCYGKDERDRLEAEILPELYENGSWRGEAVGTRKDGSTFPQELSLTVTDSGGLICVVRDITERKQQERERKQQNERLEKFADTVSHDLRNPLTVAQGRLDLARAECDSDYLDGVADAHERMATLIDDLLELTREGNRVNETESVTLAKIPTDCWQNVATADATLVTAVHQTIHADPNRLKQLLENLFRNAVEHGGTDVTVTVGGLNGKSGFYVADDGTGIPDAERATVFEAGYTTLDDGTGFGLNIVQEIAEAHGWDVQVTDSESGGARFEITGVKFVE
ncbi:PAS domain S-box protein [Halomicroarcula sp. F13]|uniref:histidine kinase n=1 Tax=Haloarcula rubra TaxID=2487747 RepID=A0AAW4PUX7_9EURY|nr:PAS domain S-box protein [Halomicroarcula rubra]MBX0325121.1 PAS domain S-box protein [Halomicroarcula rubra]